MADIPRHRKATPESVYNGWSLTKMFTVVAVLQLQEAQRPSIDDSVEKYLPFFKPESPKSQWGQVTIKHLLTHSSGLGDAGLGILGWIHHDAAGARNQTALIEEKFVDYRKLNFEPETEGRYSNVGYMVLGALIERVSGLGCEAYVRKNIVQPLGIALMNTPYVVLTESDAGSIPGLKLGLGWFYRVDEAGRVELTHGGSGMGYVSMMRTYPKESTSVIVMANSTYLEGEQGLRIVDLAGSLPW